MRWWTQLRCALGLPLGWEIGLTGFACLLLPLLAAVTGLLLQADSRQQARQDQLAALVMAHAAQDVTDTVRQGLQEARLLSGVPDMAALSATGSPPPGLLRQLEQWQAQTGSKRIALLSSGGAVLISTTPFDSRQPISDWVSRVQKDAQPLTSSGAGGLNLVLPLLQPSAIPGPVVAPLPGKTPLRPLPAPASLTNPGLTGLLVVTLSPEQLNPQRSAPPGVRLYLVGRHDLLPAADPALTPWLDRAARGESGRMLWRNGPAGSSDRPALCGGTGRCLLLWQPVPGLELGLVGLIDLPGEEHVANWPLLLGLTGGAALLLLILLARWLSRPLVQLAADSAAVIDRNAEPPESGGGREVALLTTQFNRLRDERQRQKQAYDRALSDRTSELRDARARAEANARAKSQFMAMMSHELRTPMNGLIGMAELLKDSISDDAGRRHLQVLRQSGEALSLLLNDMLDISRVDSGQMTFDSRPFSPRALLDGLLTLMDLPARDKGLSLSVSYGDGLPDMVSGDPARVRQILVNLVSNAIKYTDQGSVTVRLDTLPGSKGGETAAGPTCRLSFSVTDTGIGIPEDQQANLFEPFFRIDDQQSRRRGGTGLGLAICRMLADGMEAELSLTSSPGQGSCFFFVVEIQPLEGKAEADSSGDTLPPAPAVRPQTILIVEDEEINRQVISGLLSRAGHLVRLAKTGEEALERLTAEGADIVLTDLRLPGMNGFDVARKVRSHAGRIGRSIPVVAVTGNLLREDIEACRRAGMAEVLGKPVDPRRLLSLIAELAARPQTALAAPQAEGSAGNTAAEPDFDPAILSETRSFLGLEETRGLVRMGLETLHRQSETLLAALPRDTAPLAHKLAGCAASYGLIRLRAVARRLERAGIDGRDADVIALRRQVPKAVRDGISCLDVWLEETSVPGEEDDEPAQ